MKILMCNSYYYLRGGLERYMFELTRLLHNHGHEVIPFCMVHERNRPSKYSDYFVSHVDYPTLLRSKPGIPTVARAVGRLFDSGEARQKIRQLILDTRPDIAHIHGIGREIPPSVLDVIKSFGIPIVQTLHDFGMVCPNASFISRGELCERCKGHRYYNAVLRRCKRDSLGASLLACVSQYQHLWSNVYGRNVDICISPSTFLQRKMVEHGLQKKIVVIPNFVDLGEGQPGTGGHGYCIFFGRLLAFKGLRTLLEAARQERQAQIWIAGEGEMEAEVRRTVADSHLDNVTVLGYVEPRKLLDMVSSANFTLLPSENYENYPMAILESFVCARPIIASNIGSIPDLVTDHQNGLLFEPGNAAQLAGCIRYMFDHPEEASQMGRNGRASIMSSNDPEVHYKKIMAIYQQLVAAPLAAGSAPEAL